MLVVGCEPADLGGEDGAMGLSPEVESAVETAIETILQFVKQAPALAPR
jgi:Ni,Fe-hydrogenase maturation factor